jgi:signal peptidase II
MKKPLLLVLLVILIDQASKIWIKTNFYLGQEYKVADWFIIHFTENNGMAFGMEFAGEYGKLILSIFRILAVAGILYYLIKISRDGTHKGLVYSIALVFAGALGNILDSTFYGLLFNDSYHQVAELFPASGGYAPMLYGRVVDMLYFPLFSGFFPDWFPIWGGEHFLFFRPVFNIADTAISVGVGMIIVFQKRFFKNPKIEAAQDEMNAEQEPS